MNFWKSSEGGVGGSFPIQKFMLQIFAFIKGYFGHEFWKISATWFSENSSVLVGTSFPYGDKDICEHLLLSLLYQISNWMSIVQSDGLLFCGRWKFNIGAELGGIRKFMGDVCQRIRRSAWNYSPKNNLSHHHTLHQHLILKLKSHPEKIAARNWVNWI